MKFLLLQLAFTHKTIHEKSKYNIMYVNKETSCRLDHLSNTSDIYTFSL
jgi:hypothetical protein